MSATVAPGIQVPQPIILGPDGRKIETLPISLAQTVDACDQALRRHGMQMQIVCEYCHGAGHPAPYVSGDNGRGASVFVMACPCTKRLMTL